MIKKIENGLSTVATSYDGFILDLWGVVHNGVEPYPDTIPTLQALRAANKKVWLLSNAPRRNTVVRDKLRGMGITDDLYDGLLTSGEATFQALSKGIPQRFGKNFYFIGQFEKDKSLFEGLDLCLVDDIAKADFLLVSGVHDFADTAQMYDPVLAQAHAAGLPFVCANPDRIVHVAGQLVVCAGMLADSYTAMGGKVFWFGKPYPVVYDLLLTSMGTRRVVAIGDSMVTDIAGAAGAGIDSLLVTSGIHNNELSGENDSEKEKTFFSQYQGLPTGLLDRLFW